MYYVFIRVIIIVIDVRPIIEDTIIVAGEEGLELITILLYLIRVLFSI